MHFTSKLGRLSVKWVLLIHHLPRPSDALCVAMLRVYEFRTVCVFPLKYQALSLRICPGMCVSVCNLDPLVHIQSIFFFYLVTNEAPISVQRKENSFKYHCGSEACLSASLLSHREMTVYTALFIALALSAGLTDRLCLSHL